MLWGTLQENAKNCNYSHPEMMEAGRGGGGE
jgi:hypothetical protein